MTRPTCYSVSDLSKKLTRDLGCPIEDWQLRRVFRRDMVEPPTRIGIYRVIFDGEIPAIVAALTKLGYVQANQPTPCAEVCR